MSTLTSVFSDLCWFLSASPAPYILREEPFVFQIGRQQMIEGWEKGLLDMCVGEKRKLVVPSDMVCSTSSFPCSTFDPLDQTHQLLTYVF